MPPSRQLAAIMFTDIVGYTALMGRDEHRAFEILDINRQLHKPIIQSYGGRWIKELGDGVMATFSTVSDAVNAAIEIQQVCNVKNDYQLRIGIHQAEVVFDNDDVFGDGVNIAARIQSLAVPGAIWISESVHLNVANKINIKTEYIKTENLKNVREPVRIYQLKMDGIVSITPQHTPTNIVVPKSNSKNKITKLAAIAVAVFIVLYFIFNGFQKSLLNNIQAIGEGTMEKSIVVLPFEDMSPAKDQAYLGDGLADEIINSITSFKGLKVIGRTSSFQFKDKGLDAQMIGKKLNVANVLEGSIRKSGENIRITVNLIRVKDNFTIWSEKFDNVDKDVFSIQDSITSNIVKKLKITLSELEKPTLVKKEIDQEVYKLYLKGLFTYKKQSFEKSIEFNLKAIGIDSTFAPSYANIALAKTWIINNTHTYSDFNAIREAKEFADLAIHYDPYLAEGYSALALLAWSVELDFKKANVNFEKSIQLNPTESLIKNRYGYFLLWMGEFGKATVLAMDAIKSDPADINSYIIAGQASMYSKKFSDAEKYISEGLSLVPDKISLQTHIIESKFISGDYKAVIRSLVPLMGIKSPIVSDNLFGLLSIAYLKSNNLAESKNIFNQLKNKPEDNNSNINYCLARIYLQYNMIDSCFQSLEKSFQKREEMFRLFKIDPLFEPIRQDQRYIQLYHRYGFDRYQ